MSTLHVSAESPWLLHAGAATVLYLHIAGGSIGILSGAAALAARKGRRMHAIAGHVFFASMMVMGTIGAVVSPFLASAQGDPKRFDAIAGSFTCYLVATSWATVRRRAGTIGTFEKGAFAFAAFLALCAMLIGAKAAANPTGLAGGFPAQGYYALGGIIALAGVLDLRVILKGGVTGVPRIARHLWRMCLALFVATGSFFLGQQNVMPEAIHGSPILVVLGVAPLPAMLFWLVRIRLGKALAQLRLRPTAAPLHRPAHQPIA